MSRRSADALHGRRTRGGSGPRLNGRFSSNGISFTLKGFDEVLDTLDKMELKLQKRALKPALRAGATVIMKEARRLARKRSGLNAKNIKVKAMRRSRKVFGSIIRTGTREELGIAKKDPFYYPAIEEYGSKNQNAHPYMRPALKIKEDEAMRAIGNRIGKEIIKIAARAKKAL